ncbi:putative ATPase N2B isoform X2 [Chenopodium quinoa]|uniref:putative ATPase N2B isoform X2 n=1 Tax=Chenopodium quinoa TaxID=63459 RepID=UPI000B794378|nr:putative ATPase N2B isoform X2 [Chenopodium quinoa]
MIRRISQISNIFSHASVRHHPQFRHKFIRFYSKRPGPLVQYQNLVDQGKLQHDPYQERVASELENLMGRLEKYEKDMEEYHQKLASWEKKREEEHRRILMEEAQRRQEGGMWSEIKKKRNTLVDSWATRRNSQDVEPGVGKRVSYLNREKKLDSIIGQRPVAPVAPKGLYLYGNVGSGKTMLMDMFYSATEGVVKHRRRFHFHEAMLEINEHMHNIWKNQVEEKPMQSSISSWIMNLPFDTKVKEWLAGEELYKQEVQMNHILPAVADKFLVGQQVGQRGASILCFDEIQDGMQKEIFLKLVEKLEEHCQNVLIGSEIDYRRLVAQGSKSQVNYFCPLDSKALQEFDKSWCEVTNEYGGIVTTESIPVMFGRSLDVPQSCNGVARFSFEYLCGRPVGAADYIALAKNYHTVFISDIPAMSMRIRDKARRFITLIDELYNHHCRLFCSAACSIDDLFQGTEEGTLFDLESFQFETEMEGSKLRRDVLTEGSMGSGGSPSGIISILSAQEEMFAFHRAISRLIEMQTPLYLEGVRGLHPYFQRQPIHHENNHTRTLQSQTSI